MWPTQPEPVGAKGHLLTPLGCADVSLRDGDRARERRTKMMMRVMYMRNSRSLDVPHGGTRRTPDYGPCNRAPLRSMSL